MKSLLLELGYALCILLLTCTFCHAQIDFKATSVGTIATVSDDSTELRVGGAEAITAELLIVYEKECYDDSTYVEYLKYNSSPTTIDTLTGMTTTLAIHIPPTFIKEWQHKEPTFKDFLAWVRKKYGL